MVLHFDASTLAIGKKLKKKGKKTLDKKALHIRSDNVLLPAALEL